MRSPATLDELAFTDFGALFEHRVILDETIKRWATTLTQDDLSHVLPYIDMKGVAAKKRFSSLVMHFFNHQTHHRGQLSTLLFQAGVDIGVTDLLALIPDETDAGVGTG